VLSDDKKRSVYDRHGEAGLKGGASVSSLFSSIFLKNPSCLLT